MSKKKTTLTTSRDPKGLKFMATVEASYNKAGLDDERAQRLNESPEFVERLRALIETCSVTNRFSDEEVASSYGYFSGYKPEGEDLDRQIADLHDLFPGLGDANAEYLQQVKSGEIKVPQFGEKFFAVPNWVKHPEIFGSTYGEALQKVLGLIKKTRDGKFINYREGRLGPDRLRQSERSIETWRKLSEAQGNPDILIIAAQFGILHRGRSVRRACEVFVGNEFSLGAFAVGIMILTHPERLQNLNDLWVDCAGDEFAPDADGGFCYAPDFVVSGDEAEFGMRRFDDAYGRYGSASGFLPECPVS